MEKETKWCGNCKYYIEWFEINKMIEVCCKHRIRVIAEENICCYGWEYDDLHDNATVDSCFEEDDQTVSRQE